MKIRQGFVSNSSSSSFLVAYKDMKDFDRFSSFLGFDIFKKDMEKTEEFDEGAIKAFLISKLKEYFYTFWDGFVGERQNLLDELFDIFEVPEVGNMLVGSLDPLNAARNKFIAFKNAFWAELENDQPDLYDFVEPLMFVSVDYDDYVRKAASEEHKEIWSKAVQKYRKQCEEYYYGDEFNKIINETADKLIDDYKKSPVKLKVLLYEDHSEEGSYMEHDFMPFLAGDPEERFSVFFRNGH